MVFSQQVGVYGQSKLQGVFGHSDSETGTGVFGHTSGAGFGVRGETVTGIAVQGQSFGSGLAGRFLGNVVVTGTLNAENDICLSNGDCAEEFDVEGEENIEPGTVMVLSAGGVVCPCTQAYDRKVVGVIAGAGDYRPAIILDRRVTGRKRLPLSLFGKVFCKAEAQAAPIRAGDLLTTSALSGHAMKADDPMRGFGAVIGKALESLNAGQGLIPVLVSLR